MKKFCLIVNAGNSTTTFATSRGTTIYNKISIATDSLGAPPLSLWQEVKKFEVKGPAFIASVVPRWDAVLARIIEDLTGESPVFLSGKMDVGISIDYKPPQNLGADRIANAVAAHHLFPEQDAIVVDIGTAVNLDCITKKGHFLGGAIAPGPRLMMNALKLYTDKLPSVDLTNFSGTALGRDTGSCIRSGVLLGLAGLIEGLVKRLKHELSRQSLVILTGGGAQLLMDHIDEYDTYDPDLTLKGLSIIATRHTDATTKGVSNISCLKT